LPLHPPAQAGFLLGLPFNASGQQPVLYVKIRHASHSIRNVHQCSNRALF